MASFPYVSCNFNKNGELQFAPYVIKEFDGVKIAFVGVTTPKTLTSSGTRRPRSDNARITPMATMSDMQNTAVASLPSLKKAFALAHAPSREKRRLPQSGQA